MNLKNCVRLMLCALMLAGGTLMMTSCGPSDKEIEKAAEKAAEEIEKAADEAVNEAVKALD